MSSAETKIKCLLTGDCLGPRGGKEGFRRVLSGKNRAGGIKYSIIVQKPTLDMFKIVSLSAIKLHSCL